MTAEALREFRVGGNGSGVESGARIEELVHRVRERHATELNSYFELIEEISAEGTLTLQALAVAVRELDAISG